MPSVPFGPIQSPITVRTFLALPQLKRGLPEVLSGEDRLDQPIRWAHAGEAPNIASLLRGGELLLVIGAGIGSTDREQRRFVRELAAKGVAALAIELGHIFKAVPPALVDEARRLDFPVIALHREVAFIEISEAIHRSIVNPQFAVLQRGEEMHRRFSELMIHGAGIPEALSTLAKTISNPVVLERVGRGVLFHAAHRSSDDAVLTAWEALHRRLDDSVETFAAPIRRGDDETWGRLTVLGLDSPIDDFDRVAVDRAVGVISLALLRSWQEEVLSARERGNFLIELMDGDVDEQAAATRAAALGLAGATAWLLPVVSAVGHGAAHLSLLEDEAAWALMWRDVHRELAATGVRMVSGMRRGGAQSLLVLALDDARQRAAIADRLVTAVGVAAARHLGRRDACFLGVGAPQRTWGSVGSELRGTAAATVPGPHIDERTWYDATLPDLRLLLWSLRDHPDVRAFARRRLHPLLEHDRRHRVKLLPTLAAYCANNGRVADAARTLALKRQSMYGRLRRIEMILGVDLSNENDRLGLHLAVRALPFADPELARRSSADLTSVASGRAGIDDPSIAPAAAMR
jgi:purine catabolism regulator